MKNFLLILWLILCLYMKNSSAKKKPDLQACHVYEIEDLSPKQPFLFGNTKLRINVNHQTETMILIDEGTNVLSVKQCINDPQQICLKCPSQHLKIRRPATDKINLYFDTGTISTDQNEKICDDFTFNSKFEIALQVQMVPEKTVFFSFNCATDCWVYEEISFNISEDSDIYFKAEDPLASAAISADFLQQSIILSPKKFWKQLNGSKIILDNNKVHLTIYEGETQQLANRFDLPISYKFSTISRGVLWTKGCAPDSHRITSEAPIDNIPSDTVNEHNLTSRHYIVVTIVLAVCVLIIIGVAVSCSWRLLVKKITRDTRIETLRTVKMTQFSQEKNSFEKNQLKNQTMRTKQGPELPAPLNVGLTASSTGRAMPIENSATKRRSSDEYVNMNSLQKNNEDKLIHYQSDISQQDVPHGSFVSPESQYSAYYNYNFHSNTRNAHKEMSSNEQPHYANGMMMI